MDDVHDQFRHQAILAAAAHGRALSARSTDNPDERKQQQQRIAELGESLLYRKAALVWHRKVLRVLEDLGPNSLLATLKTDEPRRAARSTADSLRHQQQFTFDSVVFHADSLFDYTAHFVAYSFYRSPMKWIDVVRRATNAGFERKRHHATRISKGSVGVAIREAQDGFVRPLAEYRGGVIHVEVERGGAAYSFNAEIIGPQGRADITANMTLTVPKRFAKRFTIPGYEADPTQATLKDAGDWIVDQTHTYAVNVLRELERDLSGEGGDADATEGRA